MKKRILTAVIILFSANVLLANEWNRENSLSNRAENWLQEDRSENTDLRIGDAPNPPTVPLGEGWWFVALAGLGYGLFIQKRKNRKVSDIIFYD